MIHSRPVTLALALALALHAAGCPADDDAPGADATADAATDTSPTDTATADSGAPQDTASAADTAPPVDSSGALDTSVTADTAAEDTAVAADTAAAPASVVINEVVAARLDDGVDWIELANVGGEAADLGGWTLADDSDNTYVFAAGASLAAGAFLVIEEAELGFGLGKDDAVSLAKADGAPVDEADWTDGDAPAGWSYGRLPDGTGVFRTLNHPTPGAANDDIIATVILNEVVAAAADDGDDWIELYVPGPGAQDVGGWVLGDDGGNTWEIPAGTSVAAGGYQVFTQTEFAFGLGKADAVLLFTADGVLLQATAWEDGDADAGASWGRSPDGTGGFTTLEPVTPGAPNPVD